MFCQLLLGGAGGGHHDLPFGVQVRVLDVHLHEETVELGLGQRVRALQLQGILGRQHVERRRQRVILAGHGDTVFLHGLQQGRLGARAGPVDLVGEQQLAKHRPLDEAERPPPGLRFLQHLGAQDVGGHEVRGELHPPGDEAEDLAQGFDQERLAQTGHPDEQKVTARQQGNQGLLDDLGLPEDHPADTVAGGRDLPPQVFDGVDELRGAV